MPDKIVYNPFSPIPILDNAGKTDKTLNDTYVNVTGDTMTGDLSVPTIYATGSGTSTFNEGLIVNEAGGGAATDDFRAETDNEANALWVDASADLINAYVPIMCYDDVHGTFFVATVATGTQPYQCSSTTKNDNLNADYVDGYHHDQSLLTTASPTFGDITITGLSGNIITTSQVETSIEELDARLYNQQSYTIEPTGFTLDGMTGSTISFVDGTRTFTITGTNFPILISGKKYLKNTESIQIDNTSGLHWIYYDTNGTLSETLTPDISTCLIATVYWNSSTSKGILGKERHGATMDWKTHMYLHNTVGARYQSGFTGTFDATTLSITEGYFWDEDIQHYITPTQTNCLVFYKNGSATYAWDGPQSTYYKMNGSNLRYNNGTTLTDVPSNNYVAMWVFITNDNATPIAVVIGQYTDNLLQNVRDNSTYANLSLGALPYQEAKILYRVILRNTGATPTYVETLDLRGTANLSTGTFAPTSHNSLSNLDWATAGHTINADIIPTADNTYNLGSTSAYYKYGFVNRVYLDPDTYIERNSSTGKVELYCDNVKALDSSSTGIQLYLDTTLSSGKKFLLAPA